MAGGQRRKSGQKQGMTTRAWLVGITIVVVIGVVIAVVALRPQPKTGVNVEKFNLAEQPSMGSPDAPVKVVEFGDFKCPYCALFEAGVLPQLKQNYIDTDKVQFFFINIPFIGPDSYTAALAAETIQALYPDHFWDFFTAVYSAQGPESQTWATPDQLANIAAQVIPGFDSPRFLKDVNNQLYKDQVDSDVAISKAVGVKSTPALYINGEAVDDWRYESLQKTIDKKIP